MLSKLMNEILELAGEIEVDWENGLKMPLTILSILASAARAGEFEGALSMVGQIGGIYKEMAVEEIAISMARKGIIGGALEIGSRSNSESFAAALLIAIAAALAEEQNQNANKVIDEVFPIICRIASPYKKANIFAEMAVVTSKLDKDKAVTALDRSIRAAEATNQNSSYEHLDRHYLLSRLGSAITVAAETKREWIIRRTIEFVEKTNRRDFRSACLTELGKHLWDGGHGEAENIITEAVDVALKIRKRMEKASALQEAISGLAWIGKFDEALQLAEKIKKHDWAYPDTLTGIAAQMENRNDARSKEVFHKAIAVNTGIDNAYQRTVNFCTIAEKLPECATKHLVFDLALNSSLELIGEEDYPDLVCLLMHTAAKLQHGMINKVRKNALDVAFDLDFGAKKVFILSRLGKAFSIAKFNDFTNKVFAEAIDVAAEILDERKRADCLDIIAWNMADSMGDDSWAYFER